MSRRSRVYAVLAAAGFLGLTSAGAARAQEAFTIDVNDLRALGCIGATSCSVEGATVSTASGTLVKRSSFGVGAIGISGGASGSEIGIDETLVVELAQARTIQELQFMFLYNGPENGDPAEVAQVIAGGIVYTLTVRNDADDAMADWTGPGSVTKCGATTALGTGCFVVTDPFPGAVSRLEFSAIAGGQPYPADGGPGTNESDFAVGRINVAAQGLLHLPDCSGPTGCVVAIVDGQVGFSLNSVQVQNPGGSLDAIVLPVSLPDCRYIPQVCLAMLPPAGDSAASDDAARSLLISLGVIRPLDPNGPNRLNPAAQQLNVKPLLPTEVTSLFDSSGTPPNGLPNLYVGSRWRAQSINSFWFDGYFFRTDTGIVFSNVFEGLIDVSVLTGHELGCFPDTNNLLAWDVIATVSELASSGATGHVDSMINVGCINPTKVAGTRLSLYSINFELARDTWGPTIISKTPTVTVNNDAVFARLVQSLWKDLGDVRSNFACRQADPVASGGLPPLSATVCSQLATLWSAAVGKIDACVVASFSPVSATGTRACAKAKTAVSDFEAALPAAAAGPDPYNRLGELKARTNVFQHVWDERFLLSIKAAGFCRERGTCPP